ncbi:flagellar hook-length control protein FliK [Aestuariibacter salexigens]|uniref:flagellar hook-length control protein FliK n=1 Tax=Aestuariibacter salexigens TaxID=226010 RepID=UPI000479D593|nr:flagellar hook-length control protein FliK [Aestuariibacter salexigens]
MAEIPSSPQLTLQQALQTLASASSTSPLQKMAVQVVVNHLSGKQLGLRIGNTKIDLPINSGADLTSLRSTQSYQGVLTVSSPPPPPNPSQLTANATQSGMPAKVILELFEATPSSRPVPLNQQQIASLMQYIASASDNPVKQLLPLRTEAKVVSERMQSVSLRIESVAGKAITPPVDVTVKTPSMAGRTSKPEGNATISGSSSSNAIKPTPTSSYPDPTVPSLRKGDMVQLIIQSAKGQWQHRIVSKAETPLKESNPKEPGNVSKDGKSNADKPLNTSLATSRPVQLAPRDVAAIIGKAMSHTSPANHAQITFPLKDLPPALKNAFYNNTAFQRLVKPESNVVTLQLSRTPSLVTSTANKVATIPLPDNNVAKVLNAANLSLASGKAVAPPSMNTPLITQYNAGLLDKVSLNSINHKPPSQATTSVEASAVGLLKNALQNQQGTDKIETLQRFLKAEHVSGAQLLSQITNLQTATADMNVSRDASHILKDLAELLPNPQKVSADSIRSLLQTPGLVTSPTQILQPSTPSQWLNGLLTMVNIALQSRQSRGQADTIERLATLLSSASKPESVAGTSRPNVAIDLGSQDQRAQLVRALSQLLNGHLSHKLRSAEQVSQGVESFYYALPHFTGQKFKDVELLIKREPEKESDNKRSGSERKSWNLTLKLSVGELGEMLAKATVTQEQIELNLYTSNTGLRDTALNFLPMLKRRLEHHGLAVVTAQCQLGKIPSHLQQHPYQIFETLA